MKNPKTHNPILQKRFIKFIAAPLLIIVVGMIIGRAGLKVIEVAMQNSDQANPATVSVPRASEPYILPEQPEPVPPRDPLKQPFASTSIWNMPIGRDAEYVDITLEDTLSGRNDVWAPYSDNEHIILRPTAPMTPVYYSDAAWTGKDRCMPTSQKVISTVPLPADFLVPSDGENGIVAALLPDNRTIRQLQPFARCSVGAPATALVPFTDVDIYSDGITGAHGGSNLSGIGGSLRVGELRKDQPAPKHALKLNVYVNEVLFECKIHEDCFRWPAQTADNYAIGAYGTTNEAKDSKVKMGALLAIPASRDIRALGFETEPGAKLAWTLQNYGAYIVDDTYYPGIGFSTEVGPDGDFAADFKQDYGVAFEQKSTGETAWGRDVLRLLKELELVNNNTSSSIGGGGVTLQPLSPELEQP